MIENTKEISEETLRKIKSFDLVIDRIGRWPSFDDGEVLQITLDRSYKGDRFAPALIAKVITFAKRVSRDDPARKDTIIDFLFKGVREVELFDFSRQNALDGIRIEYSRSGESPKFSVSFLQGHGLDLGFECDEIEVLSVSPYSGPYLTFDR